MNKFLTFEYMITPAILKVLCYVGMVGTVVGGLIHIGTNVLEGLAIAIGGPIACRLYSELMLLGFEIHKELKKIRGGYSK